MRRDGGCDRSSAPAGSKWDCAPSYLHSSWSTRRSVDARNDLFHLLPSSGRGNGLTTVQKKSSYLSPVRDEIYTWGPCPKTIKEVGGYRQNFGNSSRFHILSGATTECSMRLWEIRMGNSRATYISSFHCFTGFTISTRVPPNGVRGWN